MADINDSGWHKRIYGGHLRNLADLYDGKAAVSRGMRTHRALFRADHAR